MSEGYEEHIAKCKTDIAQIYSMLQVSPGSWGSYIGCARSVMTSVDAIPFMADPMKIEEQVWIIEGLQNLASQEPGTRDLSDIAYWCLRNWLVVLGHHPHHIRTLRGLGQAWMLRAQPFLERIQQEEGNGTVSSSSDEDRTNSRAAREAEAWLHTANYVEARGMLLPAADYFERAVQAAEVQGQYSGDLLAMVCNLTEILKTARPTIEKCYFGLHLAKITKAAEANISLGSVSYPNTSERYFHQALDYLRRATQIPVYTLSSSLQQFLDSYGRF